MQRIVAIIAGVMLLIAMLSVWPYGYYQLNRVVVFLAGVYLAYSAYKLQKENWAWALGITAVVFNPFMPLHMAKGSWAILDLVAGITFLMSVKLFSEKHHHKE